MKLVLVALVVTGCGFPRPSDQYTCTTTSECESGRVCDRGFCVVGDADVVAIDGAVDTRIDSTGACTMFAARHFDACAIPMPGPDLMLTQAGTYTYDTDTAMLTPPTGSPTMPPAAIGTTGLILSIQSLTIGLGVTLRVVGTRPLIVASWSTINVSGNIDVSSNINGPGAGANSPSCTSHAPTVGGDDTGGGGGGGGGGFHGAGGNGGPGADGTGLPGMSGGTIALPLLAGGCNGATGGTGNESGGVGGKGGGAIQLTAKTDITISGTIHAGGAGGTGGTVIGLSGDSGGGGGGSGGMIGLEAPSVALLNSSILAANGGGGGEGANETTVTASHGGDGLLSASRAAAGTGTDGGDGGAGGAGGVLAGGAGAQDSDGGGGGGGGVGYIAIKTANLTAGSGVESPLHSVVP